MIANGGAVERKRKKVGATMLSEKKKKLDFTWKKKQTNKVM